MTETEMRSCSFCQFINFGGRTCINCGGLDQIAPLQTFRKLAGIDAETLEEHAGRLTDEPETVPNLIALGLLNLNLRKDASALRLLTRAARIGPVNPELRDLIQEIQKELAGLEIARAILARERDELGNRRIILSVDDSATVRRSMEIALGKERHVVVSVSDAEQALLSLSELRPDIVFVDFELPGINGLDLCRRVREEATTKDLPIVVLSGKVGQDFAKQAQLAGADLFLHKPIQSTALFRVVETLTAEEVLMDQENPAVTRRLFGSG